jgi:hypothetical protein
MSNLQRRATLLILTGFLVLLLVPVALAQEESPTDTTVPAEETVVEVDIPEPAVEVVPPGPADEQQAWTFRYLIPTSLVLGILVVVGSIVAYFLKVVRTRYRLIQ